MSTIIMRTLVVSAVALTLASPVAAQGAGRAERLTVTQVQELGATAHTPADHLQLRRHFTALAERYEASATRHTAMAGRYGRNPNRRTNTACPAHCKQLARHAQESASALRELALHHEQLSAGLPSAPPPAGAPFEHGAGTTDLLNAAQALELAEGARTPGEHLQLQKHFVAVAAQHTARGRRARADGACVSRQSESATAVAALAPEHEVMARSAGTH